MSSELDAHSITTTTKKVEVISSGSVIVNKSIDARASIHTLNSGTVFKAVLLLGRVEVSDRKRVEASYMWLDRNHYGGGREGARLSLNPQSRKAACILLTSDL